MASIPFNSETNNSLQNNSLQNNSLQNNRERLTDNIWTNNETHNATRPYSMRDNIEKNESIKPSRMTVNTDKHTILTFKKTYFLSLKNKMLMQKYKKKIFLFYPY